MSTITDPTGGGDCIILSVIMPGDLARALDTAAGDNLCSRAAAARQLLAASLRDGGYLKPLDAPRRHRGTRRPEAAR